MNIMAPGGGNPQLGSTEGAESIDGQKKQEQTKETLEKQIKTIKEVEEKVKKIKSGEFTKDDILQLQNLVKNIDVSLLQEPLKSLVSKIVEAVNNKDHDKINKFFKELLGVSKEDFQKTNQSIGEEIQKKIAEEESLLSKEVKQEVSSGLGSLASQILGNSDIKSEDVDKFSGLISSLDKEGRQKMENLLEDADQDKDGELTETEINNKIEEQLKSVENAESVETDNSILEKNEKVEQEKNFENKEKTSKENFFEKKFGNDQRMKDLISKVNNKELSTVKAKRDGELENGDRTTGGVEGLVDSFENAQDVVNNVTANIYKLPLVGPLLALGITKIREKKS